MVFVAMLLPVEVALSGSQKLWVSVKEYDEEENVIFGTISSW